nr:helix-turn-helix domain-containing protein [uncultured Faecalibacillus sp.]
MIATNNSFSLKLKNLRQKNNLTQEQLANELNTRYHLNESKATISQFEHNKRIPDLDRLINIADYFQVSLDYLCCDVNKSNNVNENNNISVFSYNLKKLRERYHLTQLGLAEKLKVSNGAISKWENCQREPDLSTLKKIKEYFNISYDSLLETNDNSFSSIDDLIDYIINQKVFIEYVGLSNDYKEVEAIKLDIKDMLKIISRKHK